MISRKRTSSYVLTKFFIKSHSKKYKKLMFREKIQKAIFENSKKENSKNENYKK